jgi:hypothetical protein
VFDVSNKVAVVTDGDIHGVRSHRDNRPDDEAHLAHNGHLLSPKQVGQCAYERTQSRIGNEVTNDEPNVSVDPTYVLVDERKDRAEEEERDLRADPKE